MKVGNESVVIGQIKAGTTIGDRSVVVGATDAFGNTTVREGAYGYGAHADFGSVAIGTHANATTSNRSDIETLRGLVEALGTALENSAIQGELANELRAELATLRAQASSPKPKWDVINSTGRSIKIVLEEAAGSVIGELAKPYVIPILTLAATYLF